MAVLTESLADSVARLYSEGLTFGKIGERLEISKGRVGELLKEGILSMLREQSASPEISEETPHDVPEDPQLPLQAYATKEDFETLKNSINYLASIMSGEPLSNPDGEIPSNPGEYGEEDIEVIPPEEMFIQDPSLTRKTIWLKPKTQMYFDMSRQGVFSNYEGTRDLGPFTQFNGNLSDFFNIIVDDYFIRNYNADIGLLMRRYAR